MRENNKCWPRRSSGPRWKISWPAIAQTECGSHAPVRWLQIGLLRFFHSHHWQTGDIPHHSSRLLIRKYCLNFQNYWPHQESVVSCCLPLLMLGRSAAYTIMSKCRYPPLLLWKIPFLFFETLTSRFITRLRTVKSIEHFSFIRKCVYVGAHISIQFY